MDIYIYIYIYMMVLLKVLKIFPIFNVFFKE